MFFDKPRYRNLLAFALLSAKIADGTVLFQSPQDLPTDVQYDFIVAGGGTGGGVVASRLAENPDWKVLIIEAGPSNEDIFETHPPGLNARMIGSRVDWNYTTTPQPAANGRAAFYPRGRMLGGCSSINGGTYSRGSRDDWNTWADMTGDSGLSWDNMLPIMMKSERLVMDSENQSEDGHLDPSIHGRDGKLHVSAPYTVHPFNDMLLRVAEEMNDEFPFVLDMNSGAPIGVSWAQYTSDHNATRSSSATAYVEPSKDNLHVLLNTYVVRVLPAEGTADFRGVEFAADAQSERKQLRANKEVIIAGGVIGTPQILLNSGIGPGEELDAVGVRTIVNNPSVGKNFTDQVYTNMMFNTTIQDTDFDLETALAEWNANRTGPLIMPSNLKNQIIWVRFTDNEMPFVDPTPGENSPHVEFYFSQISSHPGFMNGEVPPEVANLTTIQLALINLHPTSRGTITLNNSDSFAYPNVDPGLLSDDTDFAVLREGIKSVQRLFSAPVFAESVFGSVYPPGNLTTDEELDAFVRAEAAPYLHGGSSASMSPRGASWGVVDPDFRVKQTTGLRIVDASVLPSLPSGHTQAPVYGFAERASILIAEEWW